ncbi:glycosyltransferase family 39 protein, partial [Alphaproteobacteria bacterium]|nr:glycosyltransferase family 39 protein [Alphaproteobacteria bacterium]
MLISSRIKFFLYLFLIWFLVNLSSLIFRPVLPIDETRYLSVAWEMFVSREFIVPHLNGIAYHHKPPLLFWFINLIWLIFGDNEFLTRLVGPFFSFLSLIMTYLISNKLWKSNNFIFNYSPILLSCTLIWIFTSSLTMFDTMLTFFTLLAV